MAASSTSYVAKSQCWRSPIFLCTTWMTEQRAFSWVQGGKNSKVLLSLFLVVTAVILYSRFIWRLLSSVRQTLTVVQTLQKNTIKKISFPNLFIKMCMFHPTPLCLSTWYQNSAFQSLKDLIVAMTKGMISCFSEQHFAFQSLGPILPWYSNWHFR